MIVLHAYQYTRETLVYGLIRRAFVESAQNLTPEKAQGVVIKCALTGRKAEHVTVNHPLDEPRFILLNTGFGLNFFVDVNSRQTTDTVNICAHQQAFTAYGR